VCGVSVVCVRGVCMCVCKVCGCGMVVAVSQRGQCKEVIIAIDEIRGYLQDTLQSTQCKKSSKNDIFDAKNYQLVIIDRQVI
jgi:hypothetical protein